MLGRERGNNILGKRAGPRDRMVEMVDHLFDYVAKILRRNRPLLQAQSGISRDDFGIRALVVTGIIGEFAMKGQLA